MASQTNPHFLTLPGETRNNIYRKLFRNARIAAVGSISAKSLSKSRGLKAGLWKTYEHRRTIAILHTCSLVRAEAEPIFHDLVELHLDASDLWSILRRWSIADPLPFAKFKIVHISIPALDSSPEHVVRMCDQAKIVKLDAIRGHFSKYFNGLNTSTDLWNALSDNQELRRKCVDDLLLDVSWLNDDPYFEVAKRAVKELQRSGRPEVKVIVPVWLRYQIGEQRLAFLNMNDGVLRYIHEGQEISIKQY